MYFDSSSAELLPSPKNAKAATSWGRTRVTEGPPQAGAKKPSIATKNSSQSPAAPKDWGRGMGLIPFFFK